jgi:hypothetical protein
LSESGLSLTPLAIKKIAGKIILKFIITKYGVGWVHVLRIGASGTFM